MLEINGKQYELKFNTGRIKLVEKALGGESVTHAMLTNDGMMSLTSIEAMFSYGLKEAGSDTFCKPKEAAELCEAYMQEKGYVAAVQALQSQMKEDMGFLFRRA